MMPEPMSNIEIEDVLSSIRRLVSDDVRSVETRMRAAPEPVMPAARAGDDAAALTGRSDEPEPAPAEPAPTGPALVLTPAQRIPDPDGAAEPQVPDDAAMAVDADRTDGAAEIVSLEQTITELEAAVAGIEGEFEQDWHAGSATGAMAQDLEEVFRDPGLRDRVTLEQVAGGLTGAGGPEAPQENRDVPSGADAAAWHDDMAADAWTEDSLADAEPPAATSEETPAETPWAAIAGDAGIDGLDQAITGDAVSMAYGPATDSSAAASASLAALIGAPQPAPKPAGRLHFASAAPPAAEARNGTPDEALAAADPLPAVTALAANSMQPPDMPAPPAASVHEPMAEPDRAPEPEVMDDFLTGPDAGDATVDAAEAAAQAVPGPVDDSANPSLQQRHPQILRSSAYDAGIEAAAAVPAADDMPAAGPDADHADDNLFEGMVEQDLDIEALREVVAEIIRQELQGVLGERITRNVRKLVRREINRILETRTLE